LEKTKIERCQIYRELFDRDNLECEVELIRKLRTAANQLAMTTFADRSKKNMA